MKHPEMLIFPLIVLTLQGKKKPEETFTKAVPIKHFVKITFYTSDVGLVPQDATYFSLSNRKR